jgi:hypothetical protein
MRIGEHQLSKGGCIMVRFRIVSLLVIATLPCFAGTTTTPTSNSQALSFAAQSIAALTGGNAINDVTLTGTATWTSGSDTESGSAMFLASGTAESRMDLALSTGTRTEIRDAQTGATLGKWITPNGSGMFALYNCQTDAVWFFPALGSLAGGSNVVLSYIGQETRNGIAVQHLRSNVSQLSQFPIPGISTQALSTIDFYLDATTLLPSSIIFNAHPDANAASNLSVEIDFSNYQLITGVNVPMHIQKYFQGTLLIDVTVSNATFNTGISLSKFSVN